MTRLYSSTRIRKKRARTGGKKKRPTTSKRKNGSSQKKLSSTTLKNIRAKDTEDEITSNHKKLDYGESASEVVEKFRW